MGKDCKKKCKPNQKCDKTTGKCVMKDDRCSQFKQAPYVNPATGNKISKDGRVYRELVKECGKPDFVFNPFIKQHVPTYSEGNCGPDRAGVLFSDIGSSKLSYPTTYDYLVKYCDVLPLESIKNILGPVSYREYKLGNDINICLFGERHKIIKDCDNIKDSLPFAGFLNSLLSQKYRRFYDFFVELPYKKYFSPSIQYPLDDMVNMNLIINSFFRYFPDDIYTIPSYEYKHKNMRIHYIDYRMNNSLPSNSVKYSIPNKEREKLITMENYEKERAVVLKFLRTDRKLNKQIRESYIPAERFITFYEDQITALDTYLKTQKLDALVFMDLFAIVMDVYALARMFRTFAENKNMPSTPDNIIVYVGSVHATNYDNFLMNYLKAKKTIEIPFSKTTSCLHFSEENKRKSILF
jgi:hypothetical protein